jgi:hypothetical protein
MGDIDDVWAMGTNDRVRGIVGAVDVVKVVETFHRPYCPSEKGTGQWVLVSRLEGLNQPGRFASPYERRHKRSALLPNAMPLSRQ